MFSFQSIAFNISAGHLKLLSRFGTFVDRAKEKSVAQDMIKRLAVKTPHERQPIGAMSGGNAQKVVLARQLVERPEVLLLAEPTQGVDVGAKEEIHRIITELATERFRRAGGDLGSAGGAAHLGPAAGRPAGGPPPSSSAPRPLRSMCWPPPPGPWTRRGTPREYDHHQLAGPAGSRTSGR